MTEWKTPFKEIKVGTGRKVRSGNDIAVLSIGHIGNLAAKGIDQLARPMDTAWRITTCAS
jgi:1-deoxy-D-xylulose-5-phosphate synthase